MENRKVELAKRILFSLKNKNMPWRSDRGIPTNPQTGKKYSGINLLTLDTAATIRQYRSKFWCTYNQWYSLGMQVAKRPENVCEWGVSVVNWEPDCRKMKTHVVFNAEQMFGLEMKQYLITLNEYANVDYSEIESLIAATGADIQHSEDCPFPSYWYPPKDYIVLPERRQFMNERQYIGTKIHELFHWAESRTGWTGTEDQCEFIAEIGTGYLESEYGLPHDTDMTNCNKWLPSWIAGIEQNPQYLFDAAAQSARGLAHILSFSGLQPKKIMVE